MYPESSIQKAPVPIGTGAIFMEITDYTTFECDILDFCDEYSLKGLTSKALLELKDSHDDAVFSRACDILTNLMCKG